MSRYMIPGVGGGTRPNHKVLFVTTWGTACGIATYSANLIEELEKSDRVKVNVFTNTQSFGELVRLAKVSDATIIHFQHEFGLSLGPEAFLSILAKLRHTGKKVIITAHTEDDMFNALVDGVADCVIMHNDLKDMAHRNTFSYFEKIPHGIPTPVIPEPKSFYRKKYGIPEESFVIGTCGFLAKNSISEVLAHLAPFAAKHDNIFINLVTSAHSKDGGGKYAESIKQGMISLVKKHGFKDRFHVGMEFIPTDEYRERIYTMDVGFAFADPSLSSNSGAAADMVSCGVPVVTNEANHFAHLKDFITMVPEPVPEAVVKKIGELYEDSDMLKAAQAKAKSAIGEMSYAAVASKHIDIYDKLVTQGRRPEVEAPLDKDKPIRVAMPSDMWKVLLMWPKLHTLVVAGYKLELAMQNDGPTDVSVLQFVFGGIENITFDDIGMVRDEHLFKITSRKVAQKISVDLEAYMKFSGKYDELFPDVRAIYDFPMTLGDYAERAAKKIVHEGAVVFNVTPELIPYIREYVTSMTAGSNIILMSSPLNESLIHEARQQTLGFVGGVTVAIEDTRTRWAIAQAASYVVTGWDEVAAYCMLTKVGCDILTTEDYQQKLVEHFKGKTGGEYVAKPQTEVAHA